MTRAVGDDDAMLNSLQEVVNLFRDAQASVFKLMSSVSATVAEVFGGLADLKCRTRSPNS